MDNKWGGINTENKITETKGNTSFFTEKCLMYVIAKSHEQAL